MLDMGTNISGVYAIQHRDSGKTYVGRSTNIRHRWQEHRCDAKTGRSKNPLHRALAKYGSDAFEWRVLIKGPDRLLARLEACFIVDMKCLKPHGYNLGGAEGGFPSKQLIAEMPSKEQAAWRATMARVSRIGAAALANKRKDPDYEAAYRAVKSAASKTREANMRAKKLKDPEYAEQDRQRRSAAAKKNPMLNPEKAAATFRSRFVSDPEYAARVRTNRRRAALIGWANRKKAGNANA